MPGQDLSLLPRLDLSGQTGFGLSAYGRVLSPLEHRTWDEHCLTCQEKPCQEHNMEHILLKLSQSASPAYSSEHGLTTW